MFSRIVLILSGVCLVYIGGKLVDEGFASQDA